MTAAEVFAPAKVNLTLHVTGQDDDDYHLIDSLVAFAPAGDRLRIREAETLSLSLAGPEADGLPDDGENLVLRALCRASRRARRGRADVPPSAAVESLGHRAENGDGEPASAAGRPCEPARAGGDRGCLSGASDKGESSDA